MAALTIPWLPFPLAPAGQPPVTYEVNADGLALTAAAGTDLFVDPAGVTEVPDAGRLVGNPPPGDFSLAARVSVEFASKYDAGVLVLHAGERRWAKLCFWLRMTRSGAAWAFHASVDGSWWRLLRYFALGTEQADCVTQPDSDVRVGFLAQSPTGRGCAVTFGQICFRPGAAADLRDGS